jgi:thiamine biosynthesis lipoprotein
MSKKYSIVGMVFVGCIVVLVCLWGVTRLAVLRPGRPVSLDSGSRQIMGTFARVVAVGKNSRQAKNCIDAAFEQLQLVNNLMSIYRPESEISLVNRDAYHSPVEVSESVFEVLRRSVEFSKKSNGGFDVTVGPFMDLWRSAEKQQVTPTEQQLADAKAKVGYEKLILDEANKTVRFAVEGMRLDLGGIAKGYGIDLAVEAMQARGAVGGMVDVGGDIRCFGAAPEGKPKWTVGLQDPAAADEYVLGGSVLLVLELTDRAVTTSGNYRRFVTIAGKRYSHIVNPATSTSAEELSSVTVIAKNATDADALATAVTVLGPEKGLALIESLPDTEAILITAGPQFNRILTSGVGKYVRSASPGSQ